jgi:hypothetical protein
VTFCSIHNFRVNNKTSKCFISGFLYTSTHIMLAALNHFQQWTEIGFTETSNSGQSKAPEDKEKIYKLAKIGARPRHSSSG